MTWTHFWDMHSGGSLKEKWQHIYIEAPQTEAEVIFQNRFGHNPKRVTCTCCGEDYSIDEGESLKYLTGFHRGCAALKTPRDESGFKEPDDSWFHEHYYLDPDEHEEAQRRGYEFSPIGGTGTWQSLEDYMKSGKALFIHAHEIKPEERVGELREQGYVWVD